MRPFSELAKVLTILVVLHSSSLIYALQNDQTLCSTPACKESATYISDALNTSANPCEDFYEYTCGSWMAHHAIPEWKARTGVTEELEDLQTDQIRTLLEKYPAQLSSNSSIAVAYSAYVYQKCVALGSQPATVAVEHLKDVVEIILGFRSWNIGKPARDGQTVPSWYESYVRVLANGAVSPIFEMAIQPDYKNVTVNIINIDSSGLGLGDKDLADLNKNPKLVQAYRNYILQAAKLLCADCTTVALESDIDEIIKLESALAKAKMPVEDRRDPEKNYNKMTIEELGTKTKFDWFAKIFQSLWKTTDVKAPIDVHTKVIVSDVNYLVQAVQILATTSPRVIENYFGWLAAAQYGPHSSESFRNIVFEFNKINLGVTKTAERWRSCLKLTNSRLDWALSRLFIDNYFSEQEKQEAAVLIDEVQDAFRTLLRQNAWLDSATKNASISKLNHVTKNVAYPKWLRNNTDLDVFYALQDRNFTTDLFEDKNYLLSYARFLVNSIRKDMEELDDPIDIDKNWPMPPFIVNDAYSPDQNSITIPAGQLKPPFFNSGYPFSINYGNIGATVGHELTHGLDDEGRQFDERGNLLDWWPQSAIDAFGNHSECYVKQYGREKEPKTGLNLNGRNTLGENIADNGGLNEAFVAYKAHEAKHGPSPRLASLPNLTSDQLFFISYGYSWCSSVRTEALRNQIEYNPHSPARYRVNLPVANLPDFARAFNCPVGAPMNPAQKCLLW